MYMSEVSNMDLAEGSGAGPKISFGSDGNVADRSGFVNQKIKNGYIYMATPATGAKGTNVGPSNYSPDHSTQTKVAPRPLLSKAERFGLAEEKVFISKKHSKARPGMTSPGPIYLSTVGDIKAGRNSTVTAPGQWCP
jgi:hypothetical protein